MLHDYLTNALQKIYEHIEHDSIKAGVDAKGLDGFINECATLAAVTGAVTGLGGAFTMAIGVPVDVLNNVTQQFRVTLAVIYSRRGEYDRLSFDDFIQIVGVSLGLEVGAILTRQMLVNIAATIIKRMTVSAAAKTIPIFASVIGGSVNYMFIKGIGVAVKRMDLDLVSAAADEPEEESALAEPEAAPAEEKKPRRRAPRKAS
jgi:hypothetical protein